MSGAGALLATLRGHPRHLALASLVAGLVLGPLDRRAAVVAAVGTAALAGSLPAAPVCSALVLGGATAAAARLGALDRTALGPSLGREVTVRAVELEAPRTTTSGGRAALVRLATGAGAGERVTAFAPVRVPWPAAPPGAILALRGRLLPLGAAGAFDRRRGAHARLVARAVAWSGARRGGLRGWVDGVRGRAEAGIARGLPAREASLARGMVLGQDDALPAEVRADFRTAGLSHLVAASGANIALLAALALPLLVLAGVGLRGRGFGVLLLIALYVPLAGAGPPIQRAGVMGAAATVAGLAGRPASRTYALLLAAAVTLLVNPRAAGDPGWQLSFTAVLALATLACPMREWLVQQRLPSALADAVAITAAATLGTAPLIAFHFGRLSLVSLAANVLAAPAVAPIMWLGMLAGTVAQVAPVLALPLNAAAAPLLGYLEWLAHASARLPAASVGWRVAGPAALAGWYAALAAGGALAVRAGRRHGSPRTRGAVVALLAVLACVGAVRLGTRSGAPAPPDHLRISFLDVGQGDATLVREHEHAVLVDTGPPGGPLLARLRSAGVTRLDALVVTHAQADHEGMAATVLRTLRVGLLLDGGDGANTPEHRAIVAAALERHVPRIAPDAGQVLRAGAIALHVLWPHRLPPGAPPDTGDPNRRAIVADLRQGSFDLLLTADAESDVTGPLALPRVDVLKVAHHGSVDAGLPEELRRLRPRLAVIEVGAHNTYGHPTPQTLRALHAVVPRVLRTDRDGSVRVDVAGGRMTVSRGP